MKESYRLEDLLLRLKDRIIDNLLFITFVLSIPLVGAVVLKSITVGWLAQYNVVVFAPLILFLINIFRKKINTRTKVIGLLFVFMIVIVSGTVSIGILSDGILWFLPLLVFSGFFVSRLKTYSLIFGFLFVFSAFAFLFITGRLTYDINLQEYVISPYSWLLKGTVVLSVSLMILKTISDILASIKSLVNELKNNEEKFRVMFNSIPDAVFIHDIDANILDVNDTMLEMFSCTKEEALKYSIMDLSAPGCPYDKVEELWGNALNGIPGETEWISLNPKTGRVFPTYVKLQKMRYEGRDAIVGNVRDITEMKKAEMAMQEAEILLRTAVEQSPTGIIIFLLPEMKMKMVNKAAMILCNKSISQQIGAAQHPVAMARIAGEDLLHNKHILPLVDTIKEGETIINRQLMINSIGSETKWVSVNASPITDENENIIAGLILVHDITMLHNTSIKVRQEEEKFRDIFNSISDGILIMNTNHFVLEINSTITKMFGYTYEEIVGRQLYDFMTQDLSQAIFMRLEKMLAGQDLQPYETSIKTKNNKEIVIEFNSRLMVYQDQKAVLSLVRNVTERSQSDKEKLLLEKQLIQSQKMEAIGTMASGIAHDFNNILHSIVLSSDILRLKISEPKLLKKINIIEKSVDRASELIKQILTYSRKSDEGIELVAIDIVPILKESIRLLHNSLPSTVDINLNNYCSTAVVECDPVQIQQVIMNIATNAWHAMQDGVGLLTIDIEYVTINEDSEFKAGDYIVIIARDNGCGMPDDIRKRIFEPFFTTKEKGKGTGLGMSVSYGIIRRFKGKIEVESQPGQGTSFSIFLPLSKSVAKQNVEMEIENISGSERIMLVEDDYDIRELQTDRLEILGYKVISFNSPQQALEAFEESPDSIDIIISDYSLPKMNGLKFAEKIRQQGSIGANIPIILYSGMADFINEAELNRLDIKYKLTKPISVFKVTEAIRNLLKITER